jgi:hypothetical protein
MSQEQEIDEIKKRLKKVENGVDFTMFMVLIPIFLAICGLLGWFVVEPVWKYFYPAASNVVTTPFDLYKKASTDGKLAFIGVIIASVIIPLVIWLLNRFWQKKKN